MHISFGPGQSHWELKDRLKMCTNGEQIKLAVSLITFIVTFSKPAAVPDRKLLQISKISCSDDGYKNKELEKLPCRYDWKDLIAGIGYTTSQIRSNICEVLTKIICYFLRVWNILIILTKGDWLKGIHFFPINYFTKNPPSRFHIGFTRLQDRCHPWNVLPKFDQHQKSSPLSI